jgi:Fe-S cluster biogenesis protein NfuA
MHGITEPEPDIDLRAVGGRIDALLVASAAHGAVAHERAEELVRLVTDLYGAGLERILEIVHAAGRLDADVLAALAADDLVASLLLVHGLHPYDLPTRVERALRAVRPGLQSQGADVELVGVDDCTVRLRLVGAISGCAITTLRDAVTSAVEAAAPDASAVHVEVAATPPGPSIIPVSALRSRLARAER